MSQKLKQNRQKHKLEDGEKDIGSSSSHAIPASLEDARALSDAIGEESGLQQISIRLQKTLIDDLKAMAKAEGIGYQPFLRQLVTKEINARKRALQDA